MDKFIFESEECDIHLRDKWQFELKTEFSPNPHSADNTSRLEFFIFVPNSLQINQQTYSKAQFYEDQTNLIRYKTPEFTFKELIDPTNPSSPLVRLRNKDLSKNTIEKELKLFGNIYRSTLRDSVFEIKQEDIEKLLTNLDLVELEFSKIKKEYSEHEALVQKYFQYLEEFLNITGEYYLTGLLYTLREHPDQLSPQLDEKLCRYILKHQHPINQAKSKEEEEFILYRNGLLNKYVMDVLYLDISRSAIERKYRNWVGSLAAGFAMLIYVLLFITYGQWFVINSEPFLLLTVFAYILKDRIKDGIKDISFQQAYKWFYDYRTDILTPQAHETIGSLRESFAFIHPDQLPQDIIQVRNRDFHTMLETFKRPEQVIYYNKTVSFNQKYLTTKTRRNKLNFIFRYNILRFLTKASDPYHTYMSLDPENMDLVKVELPKVYHINIILKSTYHDVSTLKKYRLILDKDGIKDIISL